MIHHAIKRTWGAATASALAVAGLALIAVPANAATANAANVRPDTSYSVSVPKGTTLFAGDDLSDGPYDLKMQSDGNLVLYGSGYVGTQWVTTACWATGTFGSGYYATYEYSGSLVVFNELGRPVWSSNTPNAGSTMNVNASGQLWVGYSEVAAC